MVFRFAFAAALGTAVTPGAAIGGFLLLVIGGVAVGAAVGALWTWLAQRLRDELLLVVASMLVCWAAYIAAEAVAVSGVIAVVTAGLVLSWRQHVLLPAAVRIRAASFWQVLVFLMEATVFVLISFSLRDVLARAGGISAVADGLLGPLAVIVVAVVLARFVWVFASDSLVRLLHRMGLGREGPLGARAAAVMGWAGMRGVVTLAAALTLPLAFPVAIQFCWPRSR